MHFERNVFTGKDEAKVIKKEIERILQVEAILEFAARNLPGDPAAESYASAAATLQRFCERFGSQYLNEDGNLITSAKRTAVDDSIPDL